MATEIHQSVDGDAFFPDLDEKLWRETSRDAQPEENGMNYDYVVYERIPKDLQQNKVSIP
jgi:dihydrofolate reductase